MTDEARFARPEDAILLQTPPSRDAAGVLGQWVDSTQTEKWLNFLLLVPA